jgi:putative holliday junction resolvase
MRILAVDPGAKRIGLAISDPTATLARPLTVLEHVSRLEDAAAIAQFAGEYDVAMVLVGQSLDEQGRPTLEGRRAARLAAAIRSQVEIPVELWDESFSTQDARAASLAQDSPRQRRLRRERGHLDDAAAALILQSYLDSRKCTPS